MKRYPIEFRAQVISDALLMGSHAAAHKYGVPESTVASWVQRSGMRINALLKKKEQLGRLVTEYLEASLRTLIVQAYEVCNPDYIKSQPASELAVLHGVIADKTIRIFEIVSTDALDYACSTDAAPADVS